MDEPGTTIFACRTSLQFLSVPLRIPFPPQPSPLRSLLSIFVVTVFEGAGEGGHKTKGVLGTRDGCGCSCNVCCEIDQGPRWLYSRGTGRAYYRVLFPFGRDSVFDRWVILGNGGGGGGVVRQSPCLRQLLFHKVLVLNTAKSSTANTAIRKHTKRPAHGFHSIIASDWIALRSRNTRLGEQSRALKPSSLSRAWNTRSVGGSKMAPRHAVEQTPPFYQKMERTTFLSTSSSGKRFQNLKRFGEMTW